MAEARYPLDIVFELIEFGAEMVAARYRREHPDASGAEVDAAIHAWLADRSQAPHGDSAGRLVTWPRRARPDDTNPEGGS